MWAASRRPPRTLFHAIVEEVRRRWKNSFPQIHDAKQPAPAKKESSSTGSPAPTVYRSGWSSGGDRAEGATQSHAYVPAAGTAHFVPKKTN